MASSTSTNKRRSRLQPADDDAVQDLVCVGFGPASLAVAIALHDSLEAGSPTLAEDRPLPKVLFLEKQEQFAWHAGMLLPGAKMQISFVKDLATLRDPRSAFTFINYLHCNGRLVEFTNLNTFLPARAEYEDYLRWCASFFEDTVRYSTEVDSVEADQDGQDDQNSKSPVTIFRVTAYDRNGNRQVFRARNVLLATGGRPSLPACLPANNPRIIHSSQYAHLVPAILTNASAPYRVAVVGAGQSAAEIFNNIQGLYPNSKTYLVMRQQFLKPSDDSPFVNSIFNPSYIDELYPRPARYRQHLLADARATNYGVVRLELIETLYERMYHQRRTLGTDETKWPHRLLSSRRIAGVEPDEKGSLRLLVEPDDEGEEATNGTSGNANGHSTKKTNGHTNGHNGHTNGTNGHPKTEELDVDLIIAATGYQRNAHLAMLRDLWPLLPEKTAAQQTAEKWEVKEDESDSPTRILRVSRDYKVQFSAGSIADGSGVWLQGCNEGTHGLSDTLLSVLATRSGEIVESIFGREK
ncbi:L-ornithine n5-oxygenase [Grosmannia clavigera kw1407]|uniref:L-ornithine N(5)-monooxygenase [NAD(P)H] n=1 Tax=Grosmannia clavigera (strain kw1407 / UAMH 11150) TaxID=655863 RepID=F0X9P0_GROCL|nr:L-ornithine n5-oxygenase [Grosmannia clavigera kw1407]EFX05810.1 L-ornithine n5-oxygenase [Grosmannia clavigera kw1407]